MTGTRADSPRMVSNHEEAPYSPTTPTTVGEKRDMSPSLQESDTVDSTKKPAIGLEPVGTGQTQGIEGEGRMTKAKWLAIIALSLAYTTAFQQFSCLGVMVKSIDEDIGPTTYFNWMITANTIATSISLPLAGGLSDIFGRRWFLISGNVFSLIGAIVGLTAKDIPTVIASSAISGLGSGAQQLALAAVAELLPSKHRGRVAACLDLVVFPWAVFGGLTGGAMVTYHGRGGWRINFMIGVALNGIALIMAWFWYFPPSTTSKVGNKSKRQIIARLDWIGIFLLNAGIVLILVGIGFGGVTYPWTHAGTIAPITVGGVMIVLFGFWEAYGAKQPFMARELFRGNFRTFTMVLFINFVAGMGLYAASVFWAQMIRGLWEGDPIRVGILSIPAGIGGAVGGVAAGMLIGKHPLCKTNLMLVYGTIIKIIGDGLLTMVKPEGSYSEKFGMGVSFLTMLGTGWITVAIIVAVQLAIPDRNIGLATLLLGSIRAVGGSVAVTIYSSLVTNTILHDAPIRLAKATLPLGLPFTSLEPLLLLLVNEDRHGASMVPGVTEPILTAARKALQVSWSHGFRLVYVAAVAFNAAAGLAALLTKDVSHHMTNEVSVRLENEKPLACIEKTDHIEQSSAPAAQTT